MPILTLTLDNFEAELNASSLPLVVDFHAQWCAPCKMMAPVMEKLAADHPEIRFAECDVDECYPIAAHFGVNAVPAFLRFEGEEVVSRTAGYQSGEELLAALDF